MMCEIPFSVHQESWLLVVLDLLHNDYILKHLDLDYHHNAHSAQTRGAGAGAGAGSFTGSAS